MTVRRVAVIYHWEPEGYWGDAPDIPGFSAAGKTLEEVREQAREGLAFHFEEPVELVELFPDVQPRWSVTARTEVIAVGAGTWRRTLTYATEAAGTIVERSIRGPIQGLTVRSEVAYAGQ